tara:strand:- start:52 stop:246 length:195 start_codon:yes stop_codon:yes gene_type:complete
MMDYYFHFIVSQALIALKLSQLLTAILFHFNMPIELISWPQLDLTKIAKMNIILTVRTLKFFNN